MIAQTPSAGTCARASDPHFTVEVFDLLVPAPHIPPLAVRTTARRGAPADDSGVRPEKLSSIAHRVGLAQAKLRRLMAEAAAPGMAAELLRAADHLDAADEILNRADMRHPGSSPFVGLTVDAAMAIVAVPASDSLALFGAAVRQLRTAAALTLDGLAARAGVSKSYLSLVETGNVNAPPSSAMLIAIETALTLPPGTLTDRADVLRSPPSVRRLIAYLSSRVAGRTAVT